MKHRVACRFAHVWTAHRPFPPATRESEYTSFKGVKHHDEEYQNVQRLPDRFPVAVWPNFITEEEEREMVGAVEPRLHRKPYAKSHFDSVICNYRELLLDRHALPSDSLRALYARVQDHLCAPGTALADVHVLDIAENGFIAPHVDTEFTGGMVAGVSLLSDAVITFQPHVPALQERLLEEKPNKQGGTRLQGNDSICFPQLPSIELLVPARSLYVLVQEARYSWTHAIEVSNCHSFRGQIVPRTRRISLMFRDELPATREPETSSRSGSLGGFL